MTTTSHLHIHAPVNADNQTFIATFFTIFFFANRHEFSWVEGSFTAWYIAFMVWSLILLVVRVYIAGFVHKFFNALQSVGDDRAKELGEHSNYDQKCVVVP